MEDGYVVRGRLWPPRRPLPRLAFLYVHGIQSHGGWYEWSASLLADSGNPVILPDRRGSGLNEVARGDTPSRDRWLADLDELADWAAGEYGVESLAVVGVSWGGKPAAAWALRRPQRVARLLLIAPGLFPRVDLRRVMKLQMAFSLLTGGDRQFDIRLNDAALFTDNPAGRRFIADDPLKLSRATARFLYCSRRLDRTLWRARPGSLRCPLTLFLAGHDRIIHNSPTLAWARRVAGQAPEIRIFDHAAHTLEFEPDVAEFGEHVLRWAYGG